jgi:hypothetical protein
LWRIRTFKCGDQMLTADVTIITPVGGSAVLVIENGQLDLNGHALRSSTGSAVTIVFAGKKAAAACSTSPRRRPGPGRVLPFAKTQSDHGVDVSAAGNSQLGIFPVYMPHATVTLKGAVDKATNGKSCVVMVANNFQISGTAGILQTDIGQCT